MSEGEWISLIQNYGAYTTALAAIASFLILIYKKGIKPVIRHFQEWNSMIEKINHIFYEITPNGGTSIKDKIDNINTGLISVIERQRALLADAEDAYFETDMEGTCTWINRTYTRLVERNPSEILGHGWHNCVALSDRDNVIKSWYTAVKEDRELTINFSFETPSGEKKPVMGSSYKMINPEGDIIGYMGRLIIL